ncbi:MAG: hypothetical protein ACOCVF_03435 [bacterium]
MPKKKIYTIKIINPQNWYSNMKDAIFDFVVDSPVRCGYFAAIFSETNSMQIKKDDCEVISERIGDTLDNLSIRNIGMDLTQKSKC